MNSRINVQVKLIFYPTGRKTCGFQKQDLPTLPRSEYSSSMMVGTRGVPEGQMMVWPRARLSTQLIISCKK